MDPENMNRKLFLKLTLTGVATGVLSACGGDDPASTGPTGTVGTVGTTGGGTSSTTGRPSTTGTSNVTTSGGSSTTGSTTGATNTTGATGATGTTNTTGATGTTNTTGTTGSGGGTGTGTTNTSGAAGGMGGTGNTAMCTGVMMTHVSTTSTFDHDHLDLSGDEEMAFLMLINGESTAPVEFAGGDPHSHTITLTAGEIMMLVNGGMVSNKVTDADDHTHTYNISCAT